MEGLILGSCMGPVRHRTQHLPHGMSTLGAQYMIIIGTLYKAPTEEWTKHLCASLPSPKSTPTRFRHEHPPPRLPMSPCYTLK